jgi:hypothetical protein
MFVIPYSDIDSYARKATGTTYQELLQSVNSSDRYLICTISFYLDPKLEKIPGNAGGVLIENLPLIKIFNEEEVLAITNIREKILSNDLESVFLVRKRSEEEIQKAAVKMAAIAKLTPEELAALGLNNLT